MSWMDILKALVFAGGLGFIIAFLFMVMIHFINDLDK